MLCAGFAALIQLIVFLVLGKDGSQCRATTTQDSDDFSNPVESEETCSDSGGNSIGFLAAVVILLAFCFLVIFRTNYRRFRRTGYWLPRNGDSSDLSRQSSLSFGEGGSGSSFDRGHAPSLPRTPRSFPKIAASSSLSSGSPRTLSFSDDASTEVSSIAGDDADSAGRSVESAHDNRDDASDASGASGGSADVAPDIEMVPPESRLTMFDLLRLEETEADATAAE